ncbi:MAG: glycosyltransferase family 39 protein [Vicinamibacterales bacterium]
MSESRSVDRSVVPLTTVALFAMLAGAAALRFWQLGRGIPYAIGVDEPEIMDRVLRMVKTGDFNPRFFHYPTLFFYLQVPVVCLRFLIGASSGRWVSLDQVTPEDFYLWSRALAALFGTATVYVTYRIGSRWGARQALIAGALLAVMPMHVRESHYILTDVPMTFFVALTLLLSLRAHERPTTWAFAAAGASAGLAMATKYTAVVALILPLTAAIMSDAPAAVRVPGGVAAVLAAGAAFLGGAPYTLLDLPGFLNGFGDLARSYRPRGPNDESGLAIYLKYLRRGFGWPATIIAGGGAVLAATQLRRGSSALKWALLLFFPVLFLWLIQGRGLIYGRYLLPIVPFVSVLAAVALVWICDGLARFGTPRVSSTLSLTVLVLAVLVGPATQAVEFDRNLGRPSTQEVVYRWVLTNLPPGSRIVMEKADLHLQGDRYHVTNAASLLGRTAEQYRADGVDYLIATSQAFGPVFASPDRHRQAHDGYTALFATARELLRVEPGDDRSGPELRVLKVAP